MLIENVAVAAKLRIWQLSVNAIFHVAFRSKSVIGKLPTFVCDAFSDRSIFFELK